MFVALLTASAAPGAAASPLGEAETDGLVAALRVRGHDVLVHDLTDPADRPERSARASSASSVDVTSVMRHAASGGRALAVRLEAEQRWPDVVLCDGPVAGVGAHALAGGPGTPVAVWTGDLDLPTDPDARRLASAVLRSCRRVLATSVAGAALLQERRIARRTGSVPIAVDTTTFDDPGWASPGSTEPSAPIVVRVVGPGAADVAGPLRTDLPGVVVEAVNTRDAQRRTVPELRQALRTADVVVTGLPGAAEGASADGGRATLRAMACGRPVVTSDRLPDSETVMDGSSGVVVRRYAQLAAVVGSLSRDPFRREALGQGALDRVLGAHTPEVVAQRLETELLGLLPVDGPAPVDPAEQGHDLGRETSSVAGH